MIINTVVDSFYLCFLVLDPEIATPPLDGTILPGVTRMSLLELGSSWVSDVLTG